MAGDRLKLVYVGSSGRSGSTVLEMLLGAHPGFWTLGEFHVLPWELRTHTKPCGCGSPVEQCSFWGPIIAEYSTDLLQGSIDRFRDSYWADRALRFGELRFMSSASAKHRVRRQHDLKKYGNDNLLVLEQVLERARQVKGNRVSWLIDASKSPYRLLWLQETGLFDIRVIHLVKDPRAFAYSVCKDRSGFTRAVQVARATLRWNVENYLFNRLFKAHFAPEAVLRLRYEELAREPQESLRRICSWLDVPADDALAERFRNENHGISGNPARFDRGGIRLDEAWRTGLRYPTKQVVRAASFLLAGQYGFPW
jgi:hypothetical protein